MSTDRVSSRQMQANQAASVRDLHLAKGKQVLGTVAVATGVALIALGLLATVPLIHRLGSGAGFLFLGAGLASGVAVMTLGCTLQEKAREQKALLEATVKTGQRNITGMETAKNVLTSVLNKPTTSSLKKLDQLSYESFGLGRAELYPTRESNGAKGKIGPLLSNLKSDIELANDQAVKFKRGEGTLPKLLEIQKKLDEARALLPEILASQELSDEDAKQVLSANITKLVELERSFCEGAVADSVGLRDAGRGEANSTSDLEAAVLLSRKIEEMGEAQEVHFTAEETRRISSIFSERKELDSLHRAGTRGESLNLLRSDLRDLMQAHLETVGTSSEARQSLVELAALSRESMISKLRGNSSLNSWDLLGFWREDDFSTAREIMFGEPPAVDSDLENTLATTNQLLTTHLDQAQEDGRGFLEALEFAQNYRDQVGQIASSGLSHKEAFGLLHKSAENLSDHQNDVVMALPKYQKRRVG